VGAAPGIDKRRAGKVSLKKHNKVDADGVPIIDEPLFSPMRILGGVLLWTYYCEQGYTWLRLWDFVVYHRRPYASHKANKY